MLRLAELWPSTPIEDANIAVTGLTANSREVQQGSVFVALQGLRHDARQFIPQAIEQGAVAVLCEDVVGLVFINNRVSRLPWLR